MNKDDEGLTGQIIRASGEVLRIIGHGLSEAIYQKALSYELETLGLNIEREVKYPVIYKGQQIGFYVADLVVEKSVIVELKAIDALLQPAHIGQCLNYMRISKIPTGLIINFGRPRPEWKRLKL